MKFPAGPARRALAEALGTGLLVTAVVGSGVMASRVSPGDIGLQLLENSTAAAKRAVHVGAGHMEYQASRYSQQRLSEGPSWFGTA